MNTIFKEPIYKLLKKIKAQPFFKWPQPMKSDPTSRDKGKFCAYHKQSGHRTDECKSFKSHLENLVREGHRGTTSRRKAKKMADLRVEMMAARTANQRASSMSSTSLLHLRRAPRSVPSPEKPPTRSSC